MIMYILDTVRAIKKMSVNEIRDFIFKNYFKRIEFSMKNSYYSMKRLKKHKKCKNAKKCKNNKTSTCENKTKYDTFYSSSKAEIIINKSDTDDVFQSIYITITSNIQKSWEKGSDWIIDSVIDHTISISKYNLLARSSCIKLAKELDHLRKGLIDIQNIDDNECLKWCLGRYLNPADHNPKRITKTDKDFPKRLDFNDIKFPVKIRDIRKIENKNFISISVFGYENKEKYPIYVS